MITLRRITLLASTFAALALPARDLAAQDARLDARLDERTRSALLPVIDSARVAGLPIEPLVQKALEGASKRAPGDRIVHAVRRLAGQLGTAQLALGRGAAEPELVAGASALQAGVTPDVLATLRAERRDAVLTVPLGVMAELIARGVPADTAALAVTALAEAGVNDAQLVALRRDVERDIGVGAPPTTALIARTSSFTDQLTFGPSGGTGRIGNGTETTRSTTPRRRP